MVVQVAGVYGPYSSCLASYRSVGKSPSLMTFFLPPSKGSSKIRNCFLDYNFVSSGSGPNSSFVLSGYPKRMDLEKELCFLSY